MNAVKYTLRKVYQRAHNRVMDAVGRAAGFCMADCWQPMTKSYGPGFAHWRCGRLRRDHASGWHRTGHYKWLEGQPPVYDPSPYAFTVGKGALPRWLQGRHHDVMPRRQEREWTAKRFDLMTAARQAAARAVERAMAEDARQVIAGLRKAARPEDRFTIKRAMGGVTSAEALAAGEAWRRFWRSPLDPDRHDVHWHRPRCTCDVVRGVGQGRSVLGRSGPPSCPVHGPGPSVADHVCESPAKCWGDPDCPVYSSRKTDHDGETSVQRVDRLVREGLGDDTVGELGILPFTDRPDEEPALDTVADARQHPGQYNVTAYEVDADGTRHEIRHERTEDQA